MKLSVNLLLAWSCLVSLNRYDHVDCTGFGGGGALDRFVD
jgi:hypothetical protein